MTTGQQNIHKQEHYHRQIEQFLGTPDQSQRSSLHNSQANMQKLKQSPNQKQTQNQKHSKPNHQSHEKDNKQPKSHNQSTLLKKTSFYSATNSTQLDQSQIQSHHPSVHKTLLSKIEAKIQHMNQKITFQIEKEQNTFVLDYQKKLKAKLQELNRLKSITNDQMIRQKTIERKEQLKRQKMHLIEGNFYYNAQLEELKKQLDKLLQKRQSQNNNLSLIKNQTQKQSRHQKQSQNRQQSTIKTSQQHNIQVQNPDYSSIGPKRFKKRDPYFSNDEFVQKVLKHYNDKSVILNSKGSITNDKGPFNKDKSGVSYSSDGNESLSRQEQQKTYMSKKKGSILPKILQRNRTMSRSINPQMENQDYYSYRKEKFNRARSIGVMDKSKESILIDGSKKTYQSKPKVAKFFRYNGNITSELPKQIINKDQSTQKNTLPTKIIKNNNKNNDTNNKSYANKVGADPLSYTKEYLQQFIVKRKKEQTFKKPQKQRNVKSLQSLAKKENILNEKLGFPLKIETLFQQSQQEYYQFKQRQHSKGISKNIESSQFNQKVQLIEKEQSNAHSGSQISDKLRDRPIDVQTKVNTIQKQKNGQHPRKLNQFDKKLLMDMFFETTQFKKYVYDLIHAEFQSNQRTDNTSIQNMIQRLQNGFYNMKQK